MFNQLNRLFHKKAKPKYQADNHQVNNQQDKLDNDHDLPVQTIADAENAAATLIKSKNTAHAHKSKGSSAQKTAHTPCAFDLGDEPILPILLNSWKRLLGDWPLTGSPPLEAKHLQRLFATRPAFVDFLPFVNYHQEYKLFEMTDGISCGAVFDIVAPDMDARSAESIANFCESVNVALRNLPVSDDAPFVIQIYAEDRQPLNISHALRAAAKEPDSAYSKSWFEVMDEHFKMMSNPNGIYADDRTDGTKGWRAIERKITLVIFKKAPKAIWEKDKRRNSYAQFNNAIESFIKSLSGIDFKVKRMDDHAFYAWLTPWLNPTPACDMPPSSNPVNENKQTAVDWLVNNPLPRANERGAAYDLAQIICPEPPLPVDKLDAQRGIMRFGNQLSRYITFNPLHQAPGQGIFFTDRTDKNRVIASTFDQMPAESIMCFTIIPQSSNAVERKLDDIEIKTSKTTSRQSQYAFEQLDIAKSYVMQGLESIYYFQCGVYLRADNIATLDERYYSALSQIDNSRCLKPIKEDHDLFPTDSYIRNLPFVFSWQHDRSHALRATMAYTSHIAALLPFYGRSRGSDNPCFINYNRSGEVIMVNPYHKKDRSRVAHSILFGPTGSGKSATQVSQAMQSMAVNRPRQFFIDKGGSFALLGDYYAANGLKVRLINFDPSKDISFPPYAETKNALAQLRTQANPDSIDNIDDIKKNNPDNNDNDNDINNIDLISIDTGSSNNDDDLNQDTDDTDDTDEKRDYLSEMQYATELMITAGLVKEVENMTQTDRASIQEALISALEKSEARGDAHARPIDVYDELMLLSEKETHESIALRIRNMAGAMKLWTQGSRNHFFNRFGTGFSDEDDVTIIELGVLTNKANADMMAVAMISIVSSITALGEKHQYSGRHTEFYQDEAHYVTRSPLLVDGFVEGVKVWRKINIWLCMATQNVEDFPDHAKKILDLIEWWWLLVMEAAEARKLEIMLDLSAESRELIKQCKKEPPYYVEGVMLSKKFHDALIRLVPPALCLALGMTDGDEKNKLQEIQNKLKCSELEAAIVMSRHIVETRKTFSPGFVK